MKKNGFTLIELLAVIIILTMIFLITVPKINDSIEKSRKSLAYENTNRLVRALESYYARMSVKDGFNGCSYNFDSDNNTCSDFSFNGDKPSGTINLSTDGNISGTISFNGYSFSISNGAIIEG